MLYILKPLIFISLHLCVCTEDDEDIGSLVCASTPDSSTVNSSISINVRSEFGDSDFKHITEEKEGKKYHVFTPVGMKFITSVYDGDSLIWNGDLHCFSKSVKAHLPSRGDPTVKISISSHGNQSEKTFAKSNGFYYDSSTIALNINNETDGDGYKVENKVANKNGELVFKADPGKKFTLVFHKKGLSGAKLFWKASSLWYCTKVTLTKESDNIVKMALEITDGSSSASLVLVKQGKTTWVPENTIYLNTEKKEKAPHCKYTANISDNGTFSYVCDEGYSFARVYAGSKSKPSNLVWEASEATCTKVSGTVSSGKTTKLSLELKSQSDTRSLEFEKRGDEWYSVSTPPSSSPQP